MLLAVQLPRYARVNLLHTTSDDVIKRFCKEGYLLVDSLSTLSLTSCPASSSVNYQTGHCGRCAQCLAAEDSSSSADPHQCPMAAEKVFCRDTHVPELLVFPFSCSLVDHPLYTNTDIILQDKASCLPSYLLSPLPGSHVIDACAAPGNKTTHLASLMNNHGCIYAFDKDLKRFQTLKKMIKRAGASCVKPSLHDFLQINPSDYPTVRYILVDPSCSGSGIVGRMEFHTEASVDSKRLASLAAFQRKILQHALNFPSVERVVYSTCSVHEEENERVVESVLQDFCSSFHLVHIMPEWENRGRPVFGGAEHCIRAIPEKDQTNGFFVALFQRIQDEHIQSSESDVGDTTQTTAYKSDRLQCHAADETCCDDGEQNRGEFSTAQTTTALKDKRCHRSKKKKKDFGSSHTPRRKKNRRFYPVNS